MAFLKPMQWRVVRRKAGDNLGSCFVLGHHGHIQRVGSGDVGVPSRPPHPTLPQKEEGAEFTFSLERERARVRVR
jgi:hypothetical protein